MENSPFFSVVIPTYNRAGFLKRTVESLLAQDTSDFEIIVVDDGSTDHTEEVIISLKETRLKYVKKSNGERGAARNFGTHMARGQYINFFDSDDLAYPGHLRVARAICKSFNSPEVFHLGYDVKDAAGVRIRVANSFPARINESLISGNHLSCSCVFLRQDIALENPFVEDRSLSASEDYELWLRLAARFDFHGDNTVTSTLVNHDERSVLRTDKEKLIKRISALIHYAEQDALVVRYFGNRMPLFRSHLNLYIALHLAMAHYPTREMLSYLRKAVVENAGILFTRKFLGVLKNMIL